MEKVMEFEELKEYKPCLINHLFQTIGPFADY